MPERVSEEERMYARSQEWRDKCRAMKQHKIRRMDEVAKTFGVTMQAVEMEELVALYKLRRYGNNL